VVPRYKTRQAGVFTVKCRDPVLERHDKHVVMGAGTADGLGGANPSADA
jgi:hypothetical protein